MAFDKEGITKGAITLLVFSALMTFAFQLLPSGITSFFDVSAIPFLGGLLKSINIASLGYLVWGTVAVILGMMAGDWAVKKWY